jgi:hypothetical protein
MEDIMSTSQNSGGNAIKLILAWGFVGIPLTLGVIQTVINSLKLFQ